MEVNLEIYKTFYYVCKFKNLTKTAEILYVSQPAITKQIKRLEHFLGKELIIRTNKGIELTPEGEILYQNIKPHIESLTEIENNFSEKINSYEITIRIIAGHTTIKTILLKAMSKFTQKHPKVRFKLSTYPVSEALQKVRNNEADLAILSMNKISENYNDIIIKKLCDTQDILVVSKEMKRKFPDKLSILDLNKYPTIVKQNNSESRNVLENFFKEKNLEFIPTFELSNYWLIYEYIKLNLGIGPVIESFVKDDLISGNLVKIETEEIIPKRQLYYTVKKNSASYKIIKELLKEILAEL